MQAYEKERLYRQCLNKVKGKPFTERMALACEVLKAEMRRIGNGLKE